MAIHHGVRLAGRAALDVDLTLEVEGKGKQADQCRDQAKLPRLIDAQAIGGGQDQSGPRRDVHQLHADQKEIAMPL
ncbi:hypothetical protein [Brevundimonas sp.]|uniref:hypothetical protein n=1 Tax=Brevundimonas sp. TaxID=1871086 RepID=UPI0035B01354